MTLCDGHATGTETRGTDGHDDLPRVDAASGHATHRRGTGATRERWLVRAGFARRTVAVHPACPIASGPRAEVNAHHREGLTAPPRGATFGLRPTPGGTMNAKMAEDNA